LRSFGLDISTGPNDGVSVRSTYADGLVPYRECHESRNCLARHEMLGQVAIGLDTQEIITKSYRDGKEVGEEIHFDHNTLGMHLQGIEKAVQELANVLEK